VRPAADDCGLCFGLLVQPGHKACGCGVVALSQRGDNPALGLVDAVGLRTARIKHGVLDGVCELVEGSVPCAGDGKQVVEPELERVEVELVAQDFECLEPRLFGVTSLLRPRVLTELQHKRITHMNSCSVKRSL
jgi:hypothetical protein